MTDTATQSDQVRAADNPQSVINPTAPKKERRTHRKPKTLLTVVKEIPDSVRRSPTASQWTEIMTEVVRAYDEGVAEPGDSLHVRRYATGVGAKKALEKLVADEHPWAKELKVDASAFKFETRGAVDEDGQKVSDIYVTLLFGADEVQDTNAG